MKRVSFVVLLAPTIVVLPLVSGRLFTTPAWFKVGLVIATLAIPGAVVLDRYREELDPESSEYLRRRRKASGVVTVAVIATVWMVGGVDLETEVPLDLVGAAVGTDVERFDLSVELPARGSLRDLEAVGSGVRVFFPRPDNPRIQRLVLDRPPDGNDIDLIVRWRLPVWADPGDVSVMVVPVDETD